MAGKLEALKWRIKLKNEKITYKNRINGTSKKLLVLTPKIEQYIKQIWITDKVFDDASFQNWYFSINL